MQEASRPVELDQWFREHCPKGLLLERAESVPAIVETILKTSRLIGASDIHLRPTGNGVEMRFRIDGVIHEVTTFSEAISKNIVARLKVLAGLLTYRVDVPQEGRILSPMSQDETRISVFPTLHGEKVVVRLFASTGRFDSIDQLGLPADIAASLKHCLLETSGVILLNGPAGSGKTTTIYAALREIIHNSAGQRSLVSLEDPVECLVSEVDQTSVNPKGGMDMMTGLRSMVRQDPDVIMVGEIRDRETAETVFQASLIGNLILTTFHAGSCTRAISRLNDMGIEPYLLRSGLLRAFCQRLLRRLCACHGMAPAPEELAEQGVTEVGLPVGCEQCRGTGYFGRMVISEMLDPDEPAVSQAILKRLDVMSLEQIAISSGMSTLKQRGLDVIRSRASSFAEVLRVLGSDLLRQDESVAITGGTG
ncbi:MAG: type II/IV secretion system protein [Alphaproteobacteria bacterium]|nr:type II/IV secretion system protein [Alphaproteobacteria bacterium]